MRRVSLAVAFVGINLMACCCGGAGPANRPDPAQVAGEQPRVEEKPGKAKGKGAGEKPRIGSKASDKEPGALAYDAFAEEHRGELIAEWRKELASVKKALAGDEARLARSKSSAERAKYTKYVEIYKGLLERLQRNDPPYVARETADRIARYRDETTDEKIAEARKKRRAVAEAEAEAKNQANQESYEKRLETAKAAFEKETIKYDQMKPKYDKALKSYLAELTEYEATKELNVARLFKTKETVQRKLRDIVSKYPGTQSAKDAQALLDDEFVSERKVPAKPVEPTPLVKPRPNLPTPPSLVNPAYPPDPAAVAIADAARRTGMEYAQDRAAVASADAEANRRAEEEYEVDGLIVLNKTLKGVRDNIGGEITGIVVNTRDRKLTYAEIRFNLYDVSGAEAGSAIANINDLEPGGRWSFRAVTLNNRWSTYKVVSLKGF